MKVRAKAVGQYQGIIREQGEIFEIEPDKDHPASWMEPIDQPILEVIPEEKKETPIKESKRWFGMGKKK